MSAGMSAQEKDELMRTVQAQVALANMQELLSVKLPANIRGFNFIPLRVIAGSLSHSKFLS
jgi:hypothetical protein